jgi:hypothetical protein
MWQVTNKNLVYFLSDFYTLYRKKALSKKLSLYLVKKKCFFKSEEKTF